MSKSKFLSLRKKCPHPASVIKNKHASSLGWLSCLIQESAKWVWKQFHKFPLGLVWSCGNRHEGTWTQLCFTLLSIFKDLTCPEPQRDSLLCSLGLFSDEQKYWRGEEEPVLNPPLLSCSAALRFAHQRSWSWLTRRADPVRHLETDGVSFLSGLRMLEVEKVAQEMKAHPHTPVHPGVKSCAQQQLQLQQQRRAPLLIRLPLQVVHVFRFAASISLCWCGQGRGCGVWSLRTVRASNARREREEAPGWGGGTTAASGAPREASSSPGISNPTD